MVPIIWAELLANLLFHSSTAVVQLTVNQLVVGSIPACGASFVVGAVPSGKGNQRPVKIK